MKSIFGNKKICAVGFTGTQTGMTVGQKDKLTIVLEKILQLYKGFVFHHGDCIGADAESHEIALKLNGNIIIHPPIKNNKRAFCKNGKVFTEKDYLSRNRDIVDMCSILVGTPKENFEPHTKRAGGTWYTIRYARRVKKPHIVIYPDREWDINFNFDKLVDKTYTNLEEL